MAQMKTYEGCRFDGATAVQVNGQPLEPQGDILGLSPPPAFEWGYQGTGPEHLALAILCDHLDDPAKARDLAKPFRDVVIATLFNDEWTLESSDIDRVLHEIKLDQQRQSDLTQDHGIVHVDMTLEELLNKVRGIK